MIYFRIKVRSKIVQIIQERIDNMAKQQTTKAVKIIGTQQYINADTGELEDFQVTSIEERDFNFHKIWMKNFVTTLDIVGNQKTKLCFWIIDNLDKENKLCMTYRQIAEKTGMSLDTIRITMRLLIDADFIRKHNAGVYVVNPNILYKGSRTARLNVLNTYSEIGSQATKITVDEQIVNIENTINTLTQKLEHLKQSTQSTKS
jgi:DNA-binding transcriptional regulator YhcF (GntR family)